MEKLIEIRWHGRGGQGAKTAAEFLAEAAGAVGKYVQGFPEYGPERMGAPVLAFNRISDTPIRLHCHVTEPNIVVVLDQTLLGSIRVIEGLSKDGILLINTEKEPGEIKKLVGFEGKVFTIDAGKIALECIGRDIPNTPMMGAVISATRIIEYDAFIEEIEVQLEKKFKKNLKLLKGTWRP